jgi:hypothetical protein
MLSGVHDPGMKLSPLPDGWVDVSGTNNTVKYSNMMSIGKK